ncbi:unnamed protein product [Arctia plantaginis]|uniref:MOSC domain-containing protein n=1 Tax=Arctia plantaginis TaxID=874455 RepID=A0A8S1AR49_ARCPL|nr:unnamed protein product [Arctia plantaginis]
MPKLYDSAPFMAAAVSTVAVLGGAYNAYQLYQKNKKNRLPLPEEWVHVGYLKQIYAYPIKSCAPFPLNQAECSSLGLKAGWLRDRILMIIDNEDNNLITARTYPEMLKIKTTFNKAIVTLKHPKMEPIDINLAEVILMKKLIHTNVWTSPVTAFDCGQEVNAWITKCLDIEDTTFTLVYYGHEKHRVIAGATAMWPNIYDRMKQSDTGAFCDEVNCHVLSEASLDDLNSRLKEVQVTDTHFRPNIVLSGGKPYDEDNWKFVKIGENIFQVIKPCIRCLFTTRDPETGIQNKNMEPLTTLKSYRLAKNSAELKIAGDSPLMGIHMALRSGPGGRVSVNEPFYVTY